MLSVHIPYFFMFMFTVTDSGTLLLGIYLYCPVYLHWKCRLPKKNAVMPDNMYFGYIFSTHSSQFEGSEDIWHIVLHTNMPNWYGIYCILGYMTKMIVGWLCNKLRNWGRCIIRPCDVYLYSQ